MECKLPSCDVIVIDEGQPLLPRLFECVAAQSVRPARKIIVRTPGLPGNELIGRHGWEAMEARGSRGAMANAALKAATADVVVLLHPWTVLAGPETISQILSPLAADANVAGVRAMFAGSREGNRWYQRRKATRESGSGEDTVLTSPNIACCALRRAAHGRVPFPEEEGGGSEDKVWAARALAAGYTLADSPAFFLNEFQPPFVGQLRQSYKQIETYYRATGELIQHNPTDLGKVLYIVFVSAPRTAFRLALAEIVRYLAYKLIPLFNRRAGGGVQDRERIPEGSTSTWLNPDC
jgi:hypothetical protein